MKRLMSFVVLALLLSGLVPGVEKVSSALSAVGAQPAYAASCTASAWQPWSSTQRPVAISYKGAAYNCTGAGLHMMVSLMKSTNNGPQPMQNVTVTITGNPQYAQGTWGCNGSGTYWTAIDLLDWQYNPVGYHVESYAVWITC